MDGFRINKMQANPDKFQFLAVGRKTYDKNPSIHIQNFDLTCESTVTLLGIDIDYQLNLFGNNSLLFVILVFIWLFEDKLEDNKEVIRGRKSKYRQYNGKKKTDIQLTEEKDKKTDSGL
jgi:hypothetical protein